MPESPQRQGGARSVFSYLDLGLRFALSVVIASGGGYLVDKWLHTLPLFVIIGLLLGAVAGFLSIYRSVFPTPRNNAPQK